MPKSEQYLPLNVKPLSRGLRSSQSGILIEPGNARQINNLDLNRESLLGSRGSIKAGNQVALQPAVRTRPDPAFSPLFVEAGKSVPLRGYIYHGYDSELDLGGDFASSGTFPAETFHERRGRSFEIKVSVQIPQEQTIFEAPHQGVDAPDPPGIDSAVRDNYGYDEALDECTIIVQKGGDRTVPMSWALGIVNTGRGFQRHTGEPDFAHETNYCFVFMWFDSAAWAEGDRAKMRYDLSDPTSAPTGQYSTQALRAIVPKHFVVPGRTYNVSILVNLDSGSADTTTGSWNHDGLVAIAISDARDTGGSIETAFFTDTGGGGVATDIFVWKGPQDSLRYLAKYGIRYSGRDAMFTGLGYRTAPWQEQGFIPFGMDSGSMEVGGFRMADNSSKTADERYGVGAYTLHATGKPLTSDTFININDNRGLVDSNVNFNAHPTGPSGAVWNGLGGGDIENATTPRSDFNGEALRGYRLVWLPGSGSTLNGGVLNILSYSEFAAGDYRLELQFANEIPAFAPDRPFLLRAFRWSQREMVIQDLRIYSRGDQDYFSDKRIGWSQRSSLLLDDETEPNLDRLLAYWPMNDGEGRVCRELVRGKDAFFAPFGLGVTEAGSEGKQAVFLSGEGEALALDLSDNPVWEREFQSVLQGESAGFAIEISVIMPEAYYGIDAFDATRAGREFEATLCPDIASWSVKDADEAGSAITPLPLLTLSHRAFWNLAATTAPIRRPMGFQLDVSAGSDQESLGMSTAVVGTTPASNWDTDAPWVGKRITLQFGIQPTANNRAGTTPREFNVYLAASPKGVLKFGEGEPTEVEFAYYNTLVLDKKDLVRSVITIGGAWNPDSRGYTEYSCRMIVDAVRVYGTAASGVLPVSGSPVLTDDGKINGRNSLPQRELVLEDLLLPLGSGTRTVSLNQGSPDFETPGDTSFFPGSPEDTLRAAVDRFLLPLSDVHEVPSTETLSRFVREFYFIDTLSADRMTLTSPTPYDGTSGLNVSARSFNVIGYTSFSGSGVDIGRKALTLGSGEPYKPGTTTTKDLVLSEVLFPSTSPLGGGWKVRVASPFTQGGLANVLPRWVRGLVAPRRNPILGLHGLDETIFAAGRGALYEVDDRWRGDGPTDSLETSLAFRAKQDGEEIALPRASDVAVCNWNNAWPYTSVGLHSGYTWVWDAWVKIDRYWQFQTVGWLGSTVADMFNNPGAGVMARGTGWWIRLNRGRPEFVRTSASTYNGTDKPQDGEFVASSSDKVPLGRWTHIRVYLEHYNDGTNEIAKVPGIFVNGRKTTVTVNATDVDATTEADDWILAFNGGGPSASALENAMLFGGARDAFRQPQESNITAKGELGGLETFPDRIYGVQHTLDGRMADVSVWRALRADALVSGYPSFDPRQINYSAAGLLLRYRSRLQEGVGNQFSDVGTDTQLPAVTGLPSVVLSHPFVDLFSEFGRSERPVSFADFQNRVYAANGSRPAFVTAAGAGGHAGILAPTTNPTFEVEKKPLWEQNNRSTGDPSFWDPVREAVAGVEPLTHFSSFGNNFVTQSYHEEMEWSNDPDAGSADVFGFKCYWSPRDVVGRIPIWSRRSSTSSGSIFIESRDGFCYLGWYDVFLKKNVWVRTSSRVFRPGYYYYIYARKRFPEKDEQEGNWLNSFHSSNARRRADFTISLGVWAPGDRIQDSAGPTIFGTVTKVTAGKIEYILDDPLFDFASAMAVDNAAGGGTGTIDSTPAINTGDALVIREFPRQAFNVNDPSKGGTFQAKGFPGIRMGISFTSEFPRPTGTTATGPVTPKGVTYNGAAAGVIAASSPVGYQDMMGMLWQWDATVDAEIYYVVSAGGLALVVRDKAGNLPDFSSAIYDDIEGGVFTGIELVKEDDFDSSTQPDQDTHDIEYMGSRLALNPNTGIARQNGRFDCFGWVVGSVIDYLSVPIFESVPGAADFSLIGTDDSEDPIYSGLEVGELKFDSGFTFAVVNGRPYVFRAPESTQPNSDLEIPMDVEASDNALSAYWRHLETPALITGQRKIAVQFRDVGQNQRSNGGPTLIIEPTGEDQSNPSGRAEIVLDNLPVSTQEGEIHREIYMSLADGVSMFRAAVVPDNLSTSVGLVVSDLALVRGRPLDYDNNAPPDCSVLGVSQSTLFYGDVVVQGVSQADVIYYSKPFFPVSVPFSNIVPLIAGKSRPITSMQDLKGRLIVWKRDAMFKVQVRAGAAFQEVISNNVGTVGPQATHVLDRMVFWVSDRGFYFYVGSGGPHWLSSPVQDIFSSLESSRSGVDVDARRLAECSVTVVRNSDQFVMAFRAKGEPESRRRMSVEFDAELTGAQLGDQAGFRHSLYEEPAVVALGAVDRQGGGTQRVVAGLEHGFVVFMERDDTNVHLSGDDTTLYYPKTFTADAGSTTTFIVMDVADRPSFAPVLNVDGNEGTRGTTLRWVDVGGVEQRAVALFFDGTNLHLDRAITTPPVTGTVITLGAIPRLWVSKWFDAGSSNVRKRWHELKLTTDQVSSGTAIVRVYEDLSATPSELRILDALVVSQTLDLSEQFHIIPIHTIHSRWLSFSIETLAPDVGNPFELLEITVGLKAAEAH